MQSGYDQSLITNGRFVPRESTIVAPWLIAKQAQDRRDEEERIKSQQLQNEYNSQTLKDRVASQGYQTQGEGLGIPEKKLSAQQAEISGNYLNQMFGASGQVQRPDTNIPPYLTNPNGPQPLGPQPDASIPPYLANPNGPQQPPPQVKNQFEGKSLAELRQIRSQAGLEGDFLGKFIDPIIKAKSNAEELAPALQELTIVSNKPGATREQAREKAAAAQAIRAKYPALNGDERFEKAAAAALPKNPDVVFNPATSAGIEQRDINALRQASRDAAKNYKDSRDVMTTVIPEYTEYKKDPTGPVAKQLQQSLLDKFVQMSINKSPTEAQYEITQSFPGLKTVIDQQSGKLMFGQIVPEATIDGIVKIMGKAATERGVNLKQMNANIGRQAELGGVDPNRVHFIPDNIITQDSTSWAGMAGSPGATVWRADKSGKLWEYDATTKKPTGKSK